MDTYKIELGLNKFFGWWNPLTYVLMFICAVIFYAVDGFRSIKRFFVFVWQYGK